MAKIDNPNIRVTQKGRQLVVTANTAPPTPSFPVWCEYCFNSHAQQDHAECREAALSVYDSDPYWTPEYVEGWRGFRIITDTEANDDWDALLRGYRDKWKFADPGPARCIRNKPGEVDFEHRSPHPLCTCGYHALKDRADINSEMPIHAKVYLWGENGTTGGGIIEHEEGYRAERIKIVGLDYNNKGNFVFQRREYVHGTLAQLRKRYGVGGLT